MAERKPRSTFAPVALLGVASAALTALAATKTWVSAGDADASLEVVGAGSGGQAPLALALALVALAAWGVLLVTRGLVRRLMAVLALMASLGVVAGVLVALVRLPDDVRENVAEFGFGTGDIGYTAWIWVGLAVAVLAAAAAALAVRLVPTWPEMGARYDAPIDGQHAPEPTENIDVWKALDAGQDPTA